MTDAQMIIYNIHQTLSSLSLSSLLAPSCYYREDEEIADSLEFFTDQANVRICQ